ncbi:MAG: DNA polymerase I [Spirochaetes bacterium RBG_16_67_19]|nr:MAG: DNA polymerase I [Spirochaetes bacterium RBG_16_67_19]
MKEALYLLDGYSLIYRSYFAFINRPLTNPQGRNSSAVFGFFRSLFQLLAARRPAYLAVVLDSTTPTFRHEKYPEYKANREHAPEDLHAQVPVIEEILEALGVPCLRRDGYEADDLLATLAAACKREKRPCFILSGDKDILQLVGQGVSVLQPPKAGEGFTELDRDGVYRARGFWPEQVVDYLALTGDSSDNVPGVSGVGEKTALKLLGQFKDLGDIYARLAEVAPEGVRRKLEAGRQSAALSRELVALVDDLDLKLGLEDLRLEDLDREAAIPLFAREGMTSLVKELSGVSPKPGTARASQASQAASAKVSPAPPAAAEEAAPEKAATEPRTLKRGIYQTVLEEKDLAGWVTAARRAGVFAFDTETTGLDPLTSQPVGFSLALAPGRACYVPVAACDVKPLPLAVVLRHLAGLLEDPGLTLVGQNIKFDYKVMLQAGLKIRCRLFDTMVASWLIDSEQGSYGMDGMALRFLNYRTIHYEEVVGKEFERTLADVPVAEATDYSGEDADITFQLYELFSPKISALGLEGVFGDLEMPLVPVLAEMELAGIRLDTGELARYGLELDKELDRLERDIFAAVGHPFNVRSTRELQGVLFEELGLAPQRKTKTGQSTDSFVLEELAGQGRKVPELVLAHRQLAKLKSTYVDALPAMVNPVSGRVHTNFLQTGAATGRLASKDPNLQNIPVREEEGRRIRTAFVPEPGWLFLSADYAQIELVILAHLSGDPRLREAFAAGRDVHRQTAALLFGVGEKEVSAEQRRIGKTINFGVIYGMSAFRLARDMRIPRKDAGTFISTYFQRYAGVDRFLKSTVRQAEVNGFVRTLIGRRRPVPAIGSRNRTERMAAERVAVNSPIQGSAADIVKKAMLEVALLLKESGLKTRLLLQVHDELIFEAPRAEAARASTLIRQAMEGAVALEVPLRVSVETGQSWGELH